MPQDQTTSAKAELDRCQGVVERLHNLCCEPDRSPRMKAIESRISEARLRLGQGLTQDVAGQVTEILKDIGSRLGCLQVECCTEVRMPLYAEALEKLTATQLSMSRELGLGH